MNNGEREREKQEKENKSLGYRNKNGRIIYFLDISCPRCERNIIIYLNEYVF